MKLFRNFVVGLVILFPTLIFGQTVTMDGPTSVYAGSGVSQYGFNVVSSYPIHAESYSVSNSNGTASIITQYTTIDTDPQPDGYHASFLFNATFSGVGTATLSVSGGNGASRHVTVMGEWQRPPQVSIVTNESCGATQITRIQDPPAGKLWWWVNNPNDEGSAFGFGTAKSIMIYVQAQQTLYIRESNLDGTVWSNALTLGTITINKTPPPAPTGAVNAKVFVGSTAVLSFYSLGNAFEYNWYNDAGELVNQGSTYSAKFQKTETFKVTSSNGCESSPLPVTVTIVDLPKILVKSGGSIDVSGGPITLIANHYYDSYQWYYYASFAQGIEDNLGTSSTFLASRAGFYGLKCIMNDITTADNLRLAPVFYVGSNDNTNYIISNTIQKHGVTDENAVDTLTVDENNKTIQYFDGLGRPLQTIIVQGSPLKKDVVQTFVYDEFGREVIKYQPYVQNEANGWYKTDPIGNQSDTYNTSPQYNFYQSAFAVAKDDAPYAQTVFEDSPLNRALKQGAQGQSWQPDTSGDAYSLGDKTVKKRYLVNTETDAVLHFIHNAVTGVLSLTTPSKYYGANELHVDKTLDEHNNETISYTDKEGHVICKKVQYGIDPVNSTTKLYASTYYVYNDFGDLVMVLPPEGVKALAPSSN